MRLSYAVQLRDEGTGQTLGYATLSRHLQRALSDVGVVWDERAPVALHVCPPFAFVPVPGKRNIAFTMYESRDVPPDHISAMRQADMVIVPSEFCRTAFARSGLRRPLAVCPLGLWPADWPYAERTHRPSTPFKFLWLGAADKRKGWDLAWAAFAREFRPGDGVDFTFKSTMNDPSQQPPDMTRGGVTVDTRKLSQPNLRTLIEQHHALVYPSLGEGFGLVPLECMASGLLVIAPATTGMREYLHKGVAWPIETKPVKVRYGVQTVAPQPQVAHLRYLMRRAVEHYDETEELRRRASLWAHGFTWTRTAQAVLQALAPLAATAEAA